MQTCSIFLGKQAALDAAMADEYSKAQATAADDETSFESDSESELVPPPAKKRLGKKTVWNRHE